MSNMSDVGVRFTGSAAGAVGAAKETVAAVDQVSASARRSQPSLKGLEQDIGRVERGALAGTGALHGMGRAALYLGGTYIGAYGLGAAFRTASAELGEQVKLGAQARAVLLSTGGVAGITARAIDALAHAEQQKTGVDQNQIKAAELMLLRYTQVRNVAGEGNDVFTRATKIALDLSVALGRDAADSATLLGKALQDPARGLALLRRAGASFTAQQEDQIKKMEQSGNVLGAQKLLLDALAKSYGGTADAVGKAEPWNRLRGTLVSLAAEGLRPLLPELDAATTRVQKWADGVESNSAEQEKLKADVEGVITVAKDVVKAANDVAGAVGGWRRAIEILIALKFATIMSGWATAFKVFIGSEAAATGAEGAAAATGLLNKRLAVLRTISSLPFKIVIAYEIYKRFIGPITDTAGGAGDLLPVYKNGQWVDPTTGQPVQDQAYWNKYFKQAHPGEKKPSAGQTVGGPSGNAKQRAIVATAEQLGPASGGIYVTGGTGGGVIGSFDSGGPNFVPGFDCSGYLYEIYKKNGIPIPRTSEGQWNDPHATKVPKGQEQPGDGVYFTGSSEYAPPGHCGIYIGGGRYIEYYQSGKPAKVSNLADADDYWGARRWIKIKQQGGKGGADPPKGGSGSTTSKNALPVSIRQAISAADVAAAAAALTTGKADDKAATAEQRKAIDDEIAWLRAKLKTNLGSEKRITLEDLLTGALGDLASLGASKSTSGASIGSITSLRNTVANDLKGLPETLDAVEQNAVNHLESLREKLKVGLDAKDLAATRASIQNWGKVLKTEISKQAKIAADAANEAAKLWQRGWTNDVDRVLRDFQENVVQKQLDQFDRETAAHLLQLQNQFGAQTPAEKALADFDAAQAASSEAKQRATIASQIADVQSQLAALDGAGAAGGRTGTLTDIATGLQTALTAGQTAGTDIVQQRKDLLQQLADLQDQSDQLDLADQRDQLQAAADASRSAANDQLSAADQSYQDLRDAQRQSLSDALADQATALQQNLDDWDAWIEAKKKSWADFIAWLVANGFNTVGLVDPSTTAAPSTTRAAGGLTIPVGVIGHGFGGGFASGGRVPGVYVGRNDTILARVTPGERVLNRQVNEMLEQLARGGPAGPTVAVFKIGARTFATAVAQPMTSEQARQIGYTVQRG